MDTSMGLHESLPLSRLLDTWFGNGGTQSGPSVIRPALDVSETKDALHVSIELPGLAKDDVKITIENGVLTVSGEKRWESSSEDATHHRIERRYGSFYRSMALPKGIDAEAADASFENGVLRIDFPKAEEVKPRTVKIR
jgi:HSP20 family protein